MMRAPNKALLFTMFLRCAYSKTSIEIPGVSNNQARRRSIDAFSTLLDSQNAVVRLTKSGTSFDHSNRAVHLNEITRTFDNEPVSDFSVSRRTASVVVTTASTLADALVTAANNPNTTITFAGDVTVTSSFPNGFEIADGTKGLTIDGKGTFKIDGASVYPCLTVLGTQSSVTMTGLMITNGKSGIGTAGGVFIHGGSLTLNDCVVSNNFSGPQEGGGGGITMKGGTAIFTSCTFIKNKNPSNIGGGAINFLNGSLRLSSCTLTHNDAPAGGGAINVLGGTIIITLCDISNNFANVYGGGGLYLQDGVVLLKSCTLSNNQAFGQQGGAIYLTGSALTLSTCSFFGNTASAGNDLYLNCGSLIVQGTCEVGHYSTVRSPILDCVGCNYPASLLAFPANLLDTSTCAPCEPGSFAVDPGQVICTPCVKGQYAASIGAVSCTSCSSGTYSIQGVPNCSSCPLGFSSPPGSSSCFQLCPAGQFGPDSTRCSACSPGQFSLGAASCTDCPAGQFAVDIAASGCASCPAGTFAPFLASSTCVACPAGTFSQTNGAGSSTTCVDCTEGFFSSNMGSSLCKECSLETFSNSGSAECGLARANYYLDPRVPLTTFVSNVPSLPCPLEGHCDGGINTPKPFANFWVSHLSLKFAGHIFACTRATCRGASSYDPPECWSRSAAYTSPECADKTFTCTEGAVGPLCGACLSTFVFSSASLTCVPCTGAIIESYTALAVFLAGAAFVAAVKTGRFSLPSWLLRSWLVGIMRQVEMSMLKVLWATFQIISSISWSVGIVFPPVFQAFLAAISFFSFEFLSPQCMSTEGNYYLTVYIWSLTPIFLTMLIGLSYALWYFKIVVTLRSNLQSAAHDLLLLRNNHAFWIILLSYCVLPNVSLRLFQGLDCITLNTSETYLRVDTSIDCDSPESQLFRIFDGLLICVYLILPLVWLYFLCRYQGNPEALAPLSFLFADYESEYYFFDIIMMYQRLLLVSAVPLLSSDPVHRSAIGVAVSICTVAIYREIQPFLRPLSNFLLLAAQYVLLLTFLSALVIAAGVTKKLDPVAVGASLVCVNLVLLVIAIWVCFRAYVNEIESHNWAREMTTAEMRIVENVMNFQVQFRGEVSECSSVEKDSTDSKTGHPDAGQRLLQQVLLPASEVHTTRRLGVGTFGEVFEGKCMGQTVAVKTMLNVTEASVKAFRSEILLMATLRHPNIITLVGACWGQELICLVLEFASNGTLGDLLSASGRDLRWEDPLLRLAIDVARGMAYLHGRSYYDELDGRFKDCVVHRDLKPENCLITEFTLAKITDFGTSRAKAVNEIMATAVGTPLFCAPEIFRGDAYDEKVDVYSFGLLLLSMSIGEALIDFLGKCWCKAFNKKAPPAQALRLVHFMVGDDAWRPVTADDPLKFAPPSINDLIISCCTQDPQARPSFDSILHILTVVSKSQVEAQMYWRGEKHISFRKDSLQDDRIERKSDTHKHRNSHPVNIELTSVGSSVVRGSRTTSLAPMFEETTMGSALARRLAHKAGSEAQSNPLWATRKRANDSISKHHLTEV